MFNLLLAYSSFNFENISTVISYGRKIAFAIVSLRQPKWRQVIIFAFSILHACGEFRVNKGNDKFTDNNTARK